MGFDVAAALGNLAKVGHQIMTSQGYQPKPIIKENIRGLEFLVCTFLLKHAKLRTLFSRLLTASVANVDHF